MTQLEQAAQVVNSAPLAAQEVQVVNSVPLAAQEVPVRALQVLLSAWVRLVTTPSPKAESVVFEGRSADRTDSSAETLGLTSPPYRSRMEWFSWLRFGEPLVRVLPESPVRLCV